MYSMKGIVKGFTLIEISIFLAVTGALFAAVTVGVQNSIYQQRYNDTVQSFADFLGNLYSEVANVQNDVDGGRKDGAIYGKLVTFGEESIDTDNQQVIRVYNVIGKAANSWDTVSGNTLQLLKGLDANVVRKGDDGKYGTVGIVETYTPKWAAKVQAKEFEDFEGSLLIVRNPKSGTIQTFVMDDVIEVSNYVGMDSPMDGTNVFEYGDEKNYLINDFAPRAVDFCINPNGDGEYSNRMDVRLITGAHDASGVEIISFDNDNSACRPGD